MRPRVRGQSIKRGKCEEKETEKSIHWSGPLACKTSANGRSPRAGSLWWDPSRCLMLAMWALWLISQPPLIHSLCLLQSYTWLPVFRARESLSRWSTAAALQADLLASRKCQTFAAPSPHNAPHPSSSHTAAFRWEKDTTSLCVHRHRQTPEVTHYTLKNSFLGFHSNPTIAAPGWWLSSKRCHSPLVINPNLCGIFLELISNDWGRVERKLSLPEGKSMLHS